MSGEEGLIVADGVGDVHYVVFEDGHGGPWIAEFTEILEEVKAFDQAKIYLITRDRRFLLVRVESTDGDPDYMDWEVRLEETEEAGEYAGELVERAEYDGDGKPHIVSQHVHGFITGM